VQPSPQQVNAVLPPKPFKKQSFKIDSEMDGELVKNESIIQVEVQQLDPSPAIV
jgi:hypothetical protein